LLASVQKIKGAYAPFFWPSFCDLLRSSFIFFLAAFCDLVRSILLRSLALACGLGHRPRIRRRELGQETRPGFEKLLWTGQKKGEQLLP
tara:strand:+ start:1139 stop:1405 length:267 start_codon:yes stop_codon:yes gene_type:complete